MKDEMKIEEAELKKAESEVEDTSVNSFTLLHSPTEEENIELLKAPTLEEEEENVELLKAPNLEEVKEEAPKKSKKPGKVVTNEEGKRKIFEKFTSKDFVFLSIIAACTLLTSAVMPLALSAHVFGIIHLALGFQMSFFPAIGLMKVKKPGALLYMTAVFSLVPIFIMPPIGLGGLICALLTEALTILIFRGYKKDSACVFASALFFPMGLPMLYGYYKIMYKDGLPSIGKGDNQVREAVAAMVDVEPGFAIGISIAVILLCLTGAILGTLTLKKLKDSGVIKK